MARKIIKGSGIDVVSIGGYFNKRTGTYQQTSSLWGNATSLDSWKSTYNTNNGDLVSGEMARIIDLVSEGEIEGLINGLASVYLNGVPVQDPAALKRGYIKYNFDDVLLETVPGTPYQEMLSSFNNIYSDVAVGTEITNQGGGGAFLRAIMDPTGTTISSLKIVSEGGGYSLIDDSYQITVVQGYASYDKLTITSGDTSLINPGQFINSNTFIKAKLSGTTFKLSRWTFSGSAKTPTSFTIREGGAVISIVDPADPGNLTAEFVVSSLNGSTKGINGITKISGGTFTPGTIPQVEVSGNPVIRTILDTNGVDAIKLTVSTPALYYSNDDGGINPQSVELYVEYRSREQEYYQPAPIREVWKPDLLINTTTGIATAASEVNAYKLNIRWTSGSSRYDGLYSYSLNTTYYEQGLLQYRKKGSSDTWADIKILKFSGNWVKVQRTTVDAMGNTSYASIMGAPTYTYEAPTQGYTIICNSDDRNVYEFRIIKVNTPGTFNNNQAYSTMVIESGETKVFDGKIKISGKAQNKYQRTFIFPVEGPGPYDIKLSRMTADSTNVRIQNKTTWDTYAGVYFDKLYYPYSALMGIELNAKQFASIPQRAYEIKGLKVALPSNYNPISRTYNGAPTVSIAGKGTGAQAIATISGGTVTDISLISSGSGYTEVPRVYITGCAGEGATATATVSDGRVTGITLVSGGTGYTNAIWDGTFKTEFREIIENDIPVDREFILKEWTDNPAWILFDLLTNNRYGLGDFFNVRNTPVNIENTTYGNTLNTSDYAIDRYGLYTIGQYCDELVPTGYRDEENGELGMEPRFSCNLYLQTQEEAFTVINNIASIFRGMVYWSGGQLTVAQDSPAPMAGIFTNANVIEGKFEYAGTGIKGRHTVAQVTWNDPNNMYRQNIEYVESETAIQRFGYIPTDVIAMGCTSRSQAHRVGSWLLYTEQTESETVSFKTGLDGTLVYPSAIIGIRDRNRTGVRLGGRIVSSTLDTLELDGAIDLDISKQYTLTVVNMDGTVSPAYTVVNTGATAVTSISLATSLAVEPAKGALWAIAVNDLAIETWRVVSIAHEASDNTLSISAIKHNPAKYNEIESNITEFDIPIQSYLSVEKVGEIQNLTAIDSLYLVGPKQFGNRLLISWDTLGSVNYYEISYRTNDGINPGTWINKSVNINSADIVEGIEETTYEIQVRAVNSLGYKSVTASIFYTVVGKTALPNNITSIAAETLLGNIKLSWTANTDIDFDHYEVRYNSWGLDGDTIFNIYSGAETSFISPVTDYALNTPNTFYIKAVDTTGNYSELAIYTSITVSKPNGVENLLASVLDNTVNISWETPLVSPTTLPIQKYKIYINDELKTEVTNTSYSYLWTNIDMIDNIAVISEDIVGTVSDPVNTSVSIIHPSKVSNIVYSLVGDIFNISWTKETTAANQLSTSHYEIYLDGILFHSTTSTSYELVWTYGPLAKEFSVETVDIIGKESGLQTVTLTINTPEAPSLLSSSIMDSKILVTWTPAVLSPQQLPIDFYELREGGTSWETATFVAKIPSGDAALQYLYGISSMLNTGVPGVGQFIYDTVKVFRVASVDRGGSYSPDITNDVTITKPSAPSGFEVSVVDAFINASWFPSIQGVGEDIYSTPIDRYEIRYSKVSTISEDNWNTSYSSISLAGTNVQIDPPYNTTGTSVANEIGVYYYLVRAFDVFGAAGAISVTNLSISAPSAPTNLTSKVIDNNVLLLWEKPVSNTFPISRYMIKKSVDINTSYDEATLIGSKDGGFTNIFEDASGNYAYYVAPIDTAGNIGTPATLVAEVKQPPDYVLTDDIPRTNLSNTSSGTISWTQTLSNTLMHTNLGDIYPKVLGPINTTETFEEHFTSTSASSTAYPYHTTAWTSPEDQVTAGLPAFLQPAKLLGTFTEVYDYGVEIASNQYISLSSRVTNLAGTTGTFRVVIGVSTDNTSYTYTTSAPQASTSNILNFGTFATGFRYISVSFELIDGGSGTDIMQVEDYRLKLSVKYTNDGGSGQVSTTGINTVAVGTAGTGYTSAPIISISGGGGTGAKAYAEISGGGVSAIIVTNSGYGYTATPTILIEGGGGTGAVAGSVAYTSASSGTKVAFNYSYIDITSITTTYGGTTFGTAVYDFTDIPYPKYFTVLLFDSSGTAITGNFSWSAKGTV